MNTEITDNKAKKPTGWIYFDAACRFCGAHRKRWGRVFERRGFIWLPKIGESYVFRLGRDSSF